MAERNKVNNSKSLTRKMFLYLIIMYHIWCSISYIIFKSDIQPEVHPKRSDLLTQPRTSQHQKDPFQTFKRYFLNLEKSWK